MPGNAMKVSQLMAALQGMLDRYGDLDVVVPNRAADRVFAVQEMSIVPQGVLNGRQLIRSVLSIEPTDDYTASPAPDDGWNYNLGASPEGETMRVMKRRGGEDTGQRHGETWSVFENGSKAWEVAPGGVLAWRSL